VDPLSRVGLDLVHHTAVAAGVLGGIAAAGESGVDIGRCIAVGRRCNGVAVEDSHPVADKEIRLVVELHQTDCCSNPSCGT